MTDNEDQQLKIEQMSAAGNDISASQFRVMDAKGKPCALVKVLLPAEGATFEGNVVGIPEFKQGEYWVYMPDGTKQMRDVVDIGATLDERIADGFYFARSLKLVKHIFEHPELLDKPLSEPSGYQYD